MTSPAVEGGLAPLAPAFQSQGTSEDAHALVFAGEFVQAEGRWWWACGRAWSSSLRRNGDLGLRSRGDAETHSKPASLAGAVGGCGTFGRGLLVSGCRSPLWWPPALTVARSNSSTTPPSTVSPRSSWAIRSRAGHTHRQARGGIDCSAGHRSPRRTQLQTQRAIGGHARVAAAGASAGTSRVTVRPAPAVWPARRRPPGRRRRAGPCARCGPRASTGRAATSSKAQRRQADLAAAARCAATRTLRPAGAMLRPAAGQLVRRGQGESDDDLRMARSGPRDRDRVLRVGVAVRANTSALLWLSCSCDEAVERRAQTRIGDDRGRLAAKVSVPTVVPMSTPVMAMELLPLLSVARRCRRPRAPWSGWCRRARAAPRRSAAPAEPPPDRCLPLVGVAGAA